ncbi:MAG TPA: serine hydrolase domain-containing protein [Caulobacteraceae bacterium]|jgi:CubicO group peptidase (beta-lactamase class C family)|nr:serine hydrolase domain-containing protein [Caulobacteraceae bacterium]
MTLAALPRLIALGLALTLVGAIGARAAPALPAGAIGERLRDFVEAVNNPAGPQAQGFGIRDMSDAFPEGHAPAAVQRYFQGQRRVTGGVRLVGFRFDAGSRTRGTLAFRDTIYDSVRALGFVFDATPQGKILDFAPVPAPAWAIPATARHSSQEIAGYAKALVARGCRAEVFSGAFLVARNGRILMQAACGEADRSTHRRNTTDTRFNLGSINKAFTAVAVAQLIDQGRIRPDDRLSAFVDDSWLPKSVSEQITIDQLLSMTSGLGSYLDDNPMSQFASYRTMEAYKPVMRAQALLAKPGASWRYSDTGFFLLGLVIEKASGEAYHDYIRRHIYAPAGMTATDSYPLDEVAKHDTAIGYSYDTSTRSWRPNTGLLPLVGGPDGGGFSTVGDLLRFARALQSGKLVSHGSLDWLWTDHPPNNWGRGFYVYDGAAGRIVGKDGFGPGVSSEFDVYFDKGYVVVALSNSGSGALAPMDAMRAEIAGAR